MFNNRWFSLGVLLLLAFGLVACEAVPVPEGSRTDAESAQSVMPNLAGYTAVEAQNIVDALSTVAGGGSLATGNILGAVAVNRFNAMMTCYQEVGAVNGRVYASIQTQTVGVLAVINEDRLARNLIACAVNPEGLSAQRSAGDAADDNDGMCFGNGAFTYRGQSYSYIYGGTSNTVCNLFITHFNNLDGR